MPRFTPRSRVARVILAGLAAIAFLVIASKLHELR